MDDSIKLALLLSCLRITCRFFQGDESECRVSEENWDKVGAAVHIACNCDGDIAQCDLPDEFKICL